MMNNEIEKDAIDTSKLDEILPKYDPLKLNSINLAQNYVSAFNTGMNIYQCVNQLQGYIEWVVKAVNDVVKSWNVQVGESIDQSKAIVRETTTEQFNVEWTNKQPELIEQVNTLTTNQFNEDWGVLENRINTTLETQNTNIQNIQTQQTNLANQQTTLSSRMDTFTSLSEGSTTGDAELQDIRVGANGVTYNNAGDAVRGQYSQLQGDLNNYAKSDFRYVPNTENNKFCRWDTGKILPLDGKSVCSRIPVTELENVEIYSNNDVYSICFFNDETFISGSGGSSPRPKSFSIPANCNNVIISFNGLDTNIVLIHKSNINDYIVNNQVLPTYEFSVNTVKGFMRWDNGKIFIVDDYMMTQPFIVEPSREYYVDGAITIAACFLNGSTFVSGIALNGVDHFTIPEGCNRCVVDFNIIADLPNILIRDPMHVNISLCYGKVLGCLGDSITQGVGNNNHSWVDAMKGMCGFKSVYNYGVSGNTIEQMHDRINTMESALDYITLLGGTNNALWSNSQSIADFKSAFDSLVSSIIEKYPTSKVLGIIPPKYNYSSGDVTRNWNVPTSPNNLKLIDFVNAEIEIYSKYSVPIVNLFSCCNIQPDINAQKIGLMPDGVHPNQKGYFDFIAPKISEKLKSI